MNTRLLKIKREDSYGLLSFFQITRSLCISFITALVLLYALSANGADFGFSRYYSDGMVFQREKPVKIKGFAPESTKLTVSFAGQTKETRTDEKGCWAVTLDPLKANAKGQELKVSSIDGKHEVSIADVLVGDVFLFARQTSIDVSLAKQDDGKTEATKVADPGFQVLRIKTVPSPEPLKDLPEDSTSGWRKINEQEAMKMSAAAFYFARDLAKKSEVPIGIVDLNMGNYFPIAWMSLEDLLATGKVMPKDTGKELYQADNAVSAQVKTRTKALYSFNNQKGKKDIVSKVTPISPLKDPRFPAAGYNSVIHPLKGMTFKAVIMQIGNDYPYVMYQKIVRDGNGLSRAHLGWAYKQTYDIRKWCIYLEPWTIPRMVPQWRLYFDDPNLPFGLVMPPGSDLATLGEHHCWVRELQRRVAKKYNRVGLIMPGTENVPISAQPSDEKLLAKRTISWIDGSIDGISDSPSTGPVFDRFKSNYTKARIFFKKGTAEGLKADPGALNCFEAAGVDAVYYPAEARIDGSTILIECDKVNRIANVRYNWKHKPDQGLKNSAGLPAIPFRTDNSRYPSVFWHSEKDLPEEYSTPAKDWKSSEVAIINGSLASRFWHDAEGMLGACGVTVAPFGPNMYVVGIQEGSPADGKIFVGDIIYDVNGKLFGDHPLKDVAKAIALAESEAGKGDITFGLRRDGKNIDVSLKLEVLGAYSSTSPYDCPKTDRIVENMEKFLAERGGVMQTHPVFQNCDALFMMGAGTPKYQGLVRRLIYKRIANTDLSKSIDPMGKGLPKNWVLAYNALLAGEYYLATGDRNVLPFLKWCCTYLAITQNKVEPGATPWPTALKGQAGGWRHNFYGKQGYGMLPNIGLPALLGFRFAIEAGIDVDQEAYKRGIDFLIHNGAKVGSVFYGSVPEPVTVPKPIDDEKMINGQLSSFNGAKALAAILFKFEGDLRTAHLLSFMCAHSYNNTHIAHGGNFWANAWTGLGAYVHSKDAFIKFMKGNAWYRDLHRMYNHGHFQGQKGGIGGGQYLALVLPRHRLRILGAPESVFSVNPPEFLWPALEAHRQRDYAECIKLVDELMSSRTLDTKNKAKAEQLRRLCVELQESIEMDLTKVEDLIKEGKLYEAALDLPQLKGIAPKGNMRLAKIQKKLEDPTAKDAISKDKIRYNDKIKTLLGEGEKAPVEKKKVLWTCLTPHSEMVGASFSHAPGILSDDKATKWKMKVLESIKVAPSGWAESDFDDSSWLQTTLPISWPMNHTAIFRTTFEIKDKNDIEALQIRLWTYRQQNIKVYINGKLLAKVNKCINNNVTTAPLTEESLKYLKNGTNTLAVATRHNWRWGSYMGGRGTDKSNSVRNNGFTMLLDARKK